MSRHKSTKDADMISVHAIINQADKHLGYELTYKGKDIGDEPIDDGIRVARTVTKRPSQLRPSLSRNSKRDGADSQRRASILSRYDQDAVMGEINNMDFLGLPMINTGNGEK